MTKKLLVSLILVGILSFGGAFGTYAYFTSSASSASNSFTAGTLTIDSPGTITTNMSVGNLAPGVATEAKTVTVHNSGSLDFKYKMSVDPLTRNLFYDGATPLQVSINGGTWTNINSLGDVYLGEIAAHQDGTFAIAFRLPQEANNDYKGQTANFTFNFVATQTSNNTWSE